MTTKPVRPRGLRVTTIEVDEEELSALINHHAYMALDAAESGETQEMTEREKRAAYLRTVMR